MKKLTEWEAIINGKVYVFYYQKNKGKHILTVNGVTNIIKSGFISFWFGLDEKFDLDGMEARFVIEKKKPDVIINGVYVQSGKKYIQRPIWAIVFAFSCIAIPILNLGGIFQIILGFGGATLCMGISKTPIPKVIKIIVCVVITLTAWLLGFAIALTQR